MSPIVALFALLPTPAPKLSGHWLNVKAPVSIQGKVAIVHFWTFGCINCKHNLPIYDRWVRRFKNVAIVGVHTPETDFEHNEDNVKRAIVDEHIHFPVLLDPDSTNWTRWSIHYWPSVFVVDKYGNIQAKWEGELGADGEQKFTALIEDLLKQ